MTRLRCKASQKQRNRQQTTSVHPAQDLERHLKTFADQVPVHRSDALQTPPPDLSPAQAKTQRKKPSHAAHFDLCTELHRISGVDPQADS
jgi:hypothetical protein